MVDRLAAPLPRPPVRRRMPGGWVGFHNGAAWPVEDAQEVADHPGTLWHFTGEALVAAPGEKGSQGGRQRSGQESGQESSQSSDQGSDQGGHQDRARPAAPAPIPLPSLPLPRRAPTLLVATGGMRLLRGAAAPVTVPRDWLARLVPMPALQPLPFAPPGVLGLGVLGLGVQGLGGSAVLVLDGPADQPLLAVLRVENRLLGLGCTDARPDAESGGLDWLPPAALVLALAGALALALAPHASVGLVSPEEPTTPLLFCQAGGMPFAVPALEVEAVLAPQTPMPTPIGLGGAVLGVMPGVVRGVIAHRGQVLPVLDAGEALGGAPALVTGQVPMLRLAGVALAVQAVDGLRWVPLSAMTPASGPIMRAVAFPGGAAVPVLDPAWLVRFTR